MFSRKKIRSQSGITMLEIMIVVVLIGVLSSMAAPRFLNFISRMKARGDAANNASYLRSARSMAITNGVPSGVWFDNSNNQVVVFSDDDDNGIYTAGGDSIITGPVDMSGNTVIEGCTFSNNCVVFDTDGSTGSSGTVTLGNCMDTTQTYTINILASTGKVKMTVE
ncbi:MAG: prepilin-type N-terminal cleavage/methylation domain-containing protein [candidate division Zixibacteria bacterium]|nr:prepilin-type N-terminal cleavage/methylation domain-containing protein [candidate division Zixibacteria bacterium]